MYLVGVCGVILGYMLLDEGGTPLIVSESIEVLGEKETLFAGAMTAITQMLQEALKERIKYFVAEKYHIYFGYSRGIVLMIISDEKDDRIVGLVERILSHIEEKNISVEQLTFDVEAKNMLVSEIDEIIKTHPPSISLIRTIANKIIAFLDSIKGGEELKLRFEPPQRFKIKEETPIVSGEAQMENLIQRFLEGDLDYIIAEAPKLFITSEFAKVLYVKAITFANSFGTKIDSETMNNAYTVASKIADDTVRKILTAELECFIDIRGCVERFRTIEESFSDIKNKLLSSSRIESIVYLILIMPPPRVLADRIKNFIDRQNKFLYAYVDMISILEDALRRVAPDLSSWSELMGRAKYEFESMPERFLDSKYLYFFLISFLALWGVLSKEMSFDEATDLLRQSIDSYDKQQKIIEKAMDKISSNTIALIHSVCLGILLSFLLDVASTKEAKNISSKYKKRVVSILKWLGDIRKRGKIHSYIYYFLASSLLEILSRIAHELNSFYRDIPYYAKELAVEELEELWKIDPTIYILICMNLLEALGYIAMRIPMEMARRRILIEIALALERIYETFLDAPTIAMLAGVKAMRFYLATGTDKGREKAEIVGDRLASHNDFLRNLVQQRLTAKKEEEKAPPFESLF